MVEDEQAPAELRLNGIKAVELLRTSRDSRVISARRADSFDAAMDRLAERSPDTAVRAAARAYITRTRSPR